MAETVELVIVKQDESMIRCVLYPKNVADNENLAQEALFDVGKLSDKARSDYASSMGAESMLTTLDEIHGFGCRTAANANSRKAGKPAFVERTFDRIKDGYTYLGFYRIRASEIREIESQFYEMEVFHKEEDGESAHCNVTFVARSLPEKFANYKVLSRAAKTGIIAAMYRKLVGPERHVCPEDQERGAEVNAIELKKLPA